MTILLLSLILAVLVWAVRGAPALMQQVLSEVRANTAATQEVRDRLDAEAAHREKRMELLAQQRGIGRELLAERLAARLAAQPRPKPVAVPQPKGKK